MSSTQPIILPSPFQQRTIFTEPVIKKQRINQHKLYNAVYVNCKLGCGPETSPFRRRLGHESEYMCSACYWYDSRHGGQPRPSILMERQKLKKAAGGSVTKSRRTATHKPKYSSVKLTFYPIFEAINERAQEGEVMDMPKYMAYEGDELTAALVLMRLNQTFS